jgi:hypothetical protein
VDLYSERLVVWLKPRQFGATVEAFLDVENQSPDRDVLLFAQVFFESIRAGCLFPSSPMGEKGIFFAG